LSGRWKNSEMNPQISEFYRQLDLEPGANLASIRQSYRHLVKVWHPDRFGNDEKLQAVANDKLKKINFAYDSLVAFIESYGKTEASPPPKADVPPRTTKASSAEKIYRNGLDRYNAKDYKGAMRFFKQAAELGDAKGQYALGFMLYHHTTRNVFTTHKIYGEAFNWWHKAAEQGNANAQYMLGLFYQHAEGTDYNGAEARKWFERAALSGHSLAKERLNGIGRTLDSVHVFRAVPLVKWFMGATPGAPRPIAF
jgi:curved DNA-binding protein CbpA